MSTLTLAQAVNRALRDALQDDDRVKVSLPGGKVRIRWRGPGTPVKMTGPATLVFHGQIPTN